ncbi:MAG: metal-sensitive transcriptional regulator [Bacilli bacterium]|nr:metal-sensitive transcriptional regulator [Bacilli bacterium]
MSDKLVIRCDDDKNNYKKRLNIIIGQVNGINKMIDDDRHCSDILIQISAVDKALKSLGQEILVNHMKTCMVDDIKNERYNSIDEVMDLCRKLI